MKWTRKFRLAIRNGNPASCIPPILCYGNPHGWNGMDDGPQG